MRLSSLWLAISPGWRVVSAYPTTDFFFFFFFVVVMLSLPLSVLEIWPFPAPAVRFCIMILVPLTRRISRKEYVCTGYI